MSNGQTYEGPDQSDDEELAQVLEDLKMEEVAVDNTTIVVQDFEMVENAHNAAVLEDAFNPAVGFAGGSAVSGGFGVAAGGGAVVVAGALGVAAGGSRGGGEQVENNSGGGSGGRGSQIRSM